MVAIKASGEETPQGLNYIDGIRPMVVVNKDFAVHSTQNDDFLYEMTESNRGLFVREESGWEKVMCE